MDLKTNLCKTFCGTLNVNKVPAGFAVSTGYVGPDGDTVGFYVLGPNEYGEYRIQDDGLYIPTLESKGVDFSNKVRQEAFDRLLEEYDVQLDDDSGELITKASSESGVGPAALRFLAFLLRVQDLILMSVERAANTFKEDAIAVIRQLSQDRAKIEINFVIDQKLAEFPADLALFVEGRPPVAVFFALTDARIYEALLLQAYAEKEGISCSVVALLETESSANQKMRQRAANHLDASPIFRGAEQDACARIVKEALGVDPRLH